MAFGPMAVGTFNGGATVADHTDAFGLFNEATPDKGVEAMARGTRKQALEQSREVLSGGEHRIQQHTTGMDDPGQPGAVELNPLGHHAVDPTAETVSGGMMALNAPVVP